MTVDLSERLHETMLRDRHRLRKQFERLQREALTASPPKTLFELPDFDPFMQRLEASTRQVQQRRASQPPLNIPESLPIAAHAQKIVQLLHEHQVLIVCGETGSGKSTQLPKIGLLAGYGSRGVIGHTQPRRIAARSVATRLAEELSTTIGEGVGFKVRFTDRTTPQSWIKLMTDGILLAETQSDPWLNEYDLIIVDEAHERSLNIDFLLGYLHRLLHRRPELRVIITSATLDADRFANHFGSEHKPAPIVTVEGRTYPVELRYLDDAGGDDQTEEPDFDWLAAMEAAVKELWRDATGDTLVFLATEADIRAAHKRLRSAFDGWLRSGQLEILPLYARLSVEEQNRVFRSAQGRRIVLATNVAESSLTVPGIRSVIDVGTARISRYAPRSKVQRLPIEPVSQASANQRAGRCGRIAPGICIRLYSEQDYRQREPFTTPEIRRTDLATVILRTEALKLGRVEEFPFLDPPLPEAIRDGYRTLYELGAVDDHRRLSELGRRLANLPVHPRVGRMLLAADEGGCLAEMLIVASGLEIQDVRERPTEHRDAADEKHRPFLDERSDFVSLLKLWDFQHELKQSLSSTAWRKALNQNFLSIPRVLEWMDLHRQLLSICQDNHLNVQGRTSDKHALHRALLAGLLSGVAQRTDKGDYLGAGGIRFWLWPGSGLNAKRPEWIMVNEMLETSRRFGRTAAAIDVGWIEPLAPHLVSRSYNNPRWSSKGQTAMTDERVSLFGLTIVPRRSVPLRQQDPDLARRLFIEEGLVNERFEGNIAVLKENRELLMQLDDEVAKSRDLGRIVEEGRLLQWYQQRLPEDVVDAASLRTSLKQHPQLAAQVKFTKADLFESNQHSTNSQLYPDQVLWGEMRIDLTYHFEPGSDQDGATATLPAAGIKQLSLNQIPWLVPGFIEPYIEALIRSLPKSLRRQLVPAPDSAKRAAEELPETRGDFFETVARTLSRYAGEPIRTDNFDLSKIPPHLKLNFRLIDEQGQVSSEGRDLLSLQANLSGAERQASTLRHASWTREGLKCWDWGRLPDSLTVEHGDLTLSGYVGVVDQKESVSLRIFDRPEVAQAQSRLGLARLAFIACQKEIRAHLRWLPEKERWPVWGQGLVHPQQLDDQLGLLLGLIAFIEQQPECKTQVDWEARLARSTERLSVAAQELGAVLPELFRNYHQVQLTVEQLPQQIDETALTDLHHQLLDLFEESFLVKTPWTWLKQFPRYLSAIVQRLEKLPANAARDRQYRALVEPHGERWRQQATLNQRLGILDENLNLYRWLIEEYRVSLWAQPLGTSCKVSPQRLDKQWELVRR